MRTDQRHPISRLTRRTRPEGGLSPLRLKPSQVSLPLALRPRAEILSAQHLPFKDRVRWWYPTSGRRNNLGHRMLTSPERAGVPLIEATLMSGFRVDRRRAYSQPLARATRAASMRLETPSFTIASDR